MNLEAKNHRYANFELDGTETELEVSLRHIAPEPPEHGSRDHLFGVKVGGLLQFHHNWKPIGPLVAVSKEFL